MNTRFPADCHIIPLTPQGRGAVATLRVEGTDAVSLVQKFFQSTSCQMLEQIPLDRIVYGSWQCRDGLGNEDVVVCRRGTYKVEIHSHGGLTSQTMIIESLQDQGGQIRDWRDWTPAQYANDTKAAARIALASARTERTARILLDQLNGALERELAEIVNLIHAGATNQVLNRLDLLETHACVGRSLTRPWHVAVAGPPNAGKSSLINAILGFERAIVSNQPGTTRDLLTAETAFDGWPVQLLDTAGIHENTNLLELASIQLAMKQMETADLLLLVFDASQPWQPQFDSWCVKYPRAIIVHNKIDLCGSVPALERYDNIQHTTSAIQGDGVGLLLRLVVQQLVPVIPPQGAAVPLLENQITTIAQAKQWVLSRQNDLAITALSDLTR